jgi:hypothetical protein
VPDSKAIDDISEDLYEVILRYKEALSAGEFFDVGERESDRRYLASLEEQLETLKQKVLDSKAYLQLGRMQSEVNRIFLAAGTTPSVRLRMLARVVNRLSTPVVFCCGQGRISWGRLAVWSEEASEVSQTILEGEVSPLDWESRRVRYREPSSEETRELREKTVTLYSRSKSVEELRQRLDAQSAEVLSQLLSGGEAASPPSGFFGVEDDGIQEPCSFVLHSPTSPIGKEGL